MMRDINVNIGYFDGLANGHILPDFITIPVNTISIELLMELTLIDLIFKCVETNLFVGFFV